MFFTYIKQWNKVFEKRSSSAKLNIISLYLLPPSAVRFHQAGLKYSVDVPLNVIMAFCCNLTSSFNTWFFDWPHISQPYEKFEAKSAYYIGNQWFCKVFYFSLGKRSFALQNFSSKYLCCGLIQASFIVQSTLGCCDLCTQIQNFWNTYSNLNF